MDRRPGLKVGWLEIELQAAAAERLRWPVEVQARAPQLAEKAEKGGANSVDHPHVKARG